MNIKRIALVLVLVLLTVGGGIGYTYHSERTPERAMSELQAGIKSRDYNKVKQYADLGALIETTYDESTKIMADNIESLSKTYPQDWFFRHDTAFMQNYIAARRGDDLVFIQRTLDFYMDQQATPLSRVEGQAKWVSDEMTKFEDSYTADVKSVQQKDGMALATVEFTGKDTEYGRLVPHLTVVLELTRQPDEHWKVTRVHNVDEAFDPVLKGIEDYCTLQGWQ